MVADSEVRTGLPLGLEGWGSFRYSMLNHAADEGVWDLYAGADYLFGNTVFGFLAGYEPGRLTSEGVRLEAEHVQFGLYGGHRLGGALILDAAAGYGRGAGELSLPGGSGRPVTATYDSDRLAIRIGVTGDFGWGGDSWRIEPQLELLHTEEDLGAFTDSLGAVAPADRLWLTRLGFGPRLVWTRGNSTTRANLRANLDTHSLGSEDATAEANQWSGAIQLGHGWQPHDRISLDFSGSYDGLGSEWFSSSSLGLNLRWRF